MSEIPRIFVDKNNIDYNSASIIVEDKDNLHYLINVLRLEDFDSVIVLDGNYNCFSTQVNKIDKKAIHLNIIEKHSLNKFPLTEINLFQGIIKGEKLDYIIQKASELGVSSINMMITDFSNIKIKANSSIESKINRWKKIAINASRQSKRATIPEIRFYSSLNNSFISDNNIIKHSVNITCFEDRSVDTIKQYFKTFTINPSKINLFIGPEGGWSQNESEIFDKYSVKKVNLGNNILRAETATIVSIGILIYELEL